MTGARAWPAAVTLALAWGILPLLPALLAGAIPGSPHTDLYPAVWGLGWFVDHAGELLPTFAPELAAPRGMPFYYSSPLHGWLAVPLRPVLGLVGAYTAGIVLARVATVLCAHAAGLALGLAPGGALVLAAVFGCAPFFHGYTVEGIVEGTDGWPLALWVALAARGRHRGAVAAAFLVVAASWYLALAGALLALVVLPFRWRVSLTFLAGALLALPLLVAFLGAFSGERALDPAVRAAMGATLDAFPRPGLASGLHPFAKTTWVGWIAPALALFAVRRRPLVAAGVLGAFVLSLGVGPWWSLPVLDAVRFPYRLHVLTLLGLGLLAGLTASRARPAAAPLLALAIVLEGLLLSPIEPIVPSAPADVPAEILALGGEVVLDLPGPLARPPGVENPSRPRARYLLYWMGRSGHRSAWAPDFNAVGAAGTEVPPLDAARTWDPAENAPQRPFTPTELRAAGIDAVVLHRRELGADTVAGLRGLLTGSGASIRAETEDLVILGGW